MSVKKLELQFEDNGSYTMLGIVTALPDYMLAFRINQKIQTDFQRFDDFVFDTEKNKFSYTWFFTYFDEYKTNIHLISNNHPKKKLITKLKNIDFFVAFSSDSKPEMIEILTKKIRDIEGVNGVYKLNTRKLNNAELLFEKLELHEINSLKNR